MAGVVVTAEGDIINLVDMVLEYRDPELLTSTQQPGAALSKAIVEGSLASVTYALDEAGEATWRVVLTDHRVLTLTGGEVRFSGVVVGANASGLVGYLSGNLGAHPTSDTEFVALAISPGSP